MVYFPEGMQHFDAYVEAVGRAQDYAGLKRRMMMANVMCVLRSAMPKPFEAELEVVSRHYSYIRRKKHS